MKILLQDTMTSRYVGGGGSGWTTRREDARDFNSGMDALTFCFSGRLLNMQMIIDYPDPTLSFTCPVTDARQA